MLYVSLYVPEGQEPFSRDVLNEPMIAKYVDSWGREGDIGFIALNKQNEPIGSVTLRYFDESNQGLGMWIMMCLSLAWQSSMLIEEKVSMVAEL
ncbi:hypothetical protein [Paenibacillus sinopodophylli]|uniref:hypothetical protein n=1 Tax=Paenibacillus sinopodophylli TaxID=1837342 RepID=UPI00110CE5E3|nr:hypothetical protein [Paenibacillus sinopodophylli]